MKNNFIVIGDSIVYGIGGYEQNGWVSMLKNKLLNQEGTKESTNYVHCVGFPGATSIDILGKIESIINTYYNKDMNNVFLLSIGVNDTQIFKGKNKNGIDDYEKNITEIINTINKNDNCKIVVLGLTEIREKEEPFFWKTDKYYDNDTIVSYDGILREVCINNKVEYISMMDVLGENDYIDGLHPNDSGYDKIAQKVFLSVK